MDITSSILFLNKDIGAQIGCILWKVSIYIACVAATFRWLGLRVKH